MVKYDPEKLKKFPKKCILEEDKVCDNCCECFVCDLDPLKTCDNCAKCLELADFNAIEISDILLYDDKIFEYGKNGKTGKNGKKEKSRAPTKKEKSGP
ncbi:MAG: hypothetical protein JL50_14585 [Peptococcaceae bacterium BICA1-7]|nr:MAG: hypothetical protein JL50_14585 [Peptococcaceae bacterium BICA1-7]